MTDQTAPAPLTMRGATFDAFRKREKSGVLLGATIAYVVLVLLLGGIFWALAWRGYVDFFYWMMQAFESGVGTSPEMLTPPASVSFVQNLGFLFQVAYYIVLAAFEAACLRWLLRGETRGILGISFGADTWYVWACYWVWLVLFIGLYIAVFIVGLIATFIIVVARLEPVFIALIVLGGGLALVCAIIWVAVRLAPATAATVALQRFAFFDAWRVTRGRFWTLFGSFFLLVLLFIVAVLAIKGIALIPLYASLGALISEAMSSGTMPTGEQIVKLFSPAALVSLGFAASFGFVAGMVFRIALFGVNARAALVAQQEGRLS